MSLYSLVERIEFSGTIERLLFSKFFEELGNDWRKSNLGEESGLAPIFGHFTPLVDCVITLS
jgi:hypothetical protein